LHATGYADLIATTPTGAIIDWPGTAPNGTTATFANPKATGGAVMTLVNAALNTCLDSNYAGSLYSDACNGGNYQDWIVTPNSDGTWSLTDDQTGLCLDRQRHLVLCQPLQQRQLPALDTDVGRLGLDPHQPGHRQSHRRQRQPLLQHPERRPLPAVEVAPPSNR